MAFIYDRQTHAAVDKERNLSVSLGPREGPENDPPHQYTYESSDLSFIFRAVERYERRKYMWKGELVERSVPVEINIFEKTLVSGVRKALGNSVTQEKIEELKVAVKEGIYALCAIHILDTNTQIVPDFKVYYEW